MKSRSPGLHTLRALPRAQLLAGQTWERSRAAGMNALNLPGDPGSLLTEHAAAVDTAYLPTGSGMAGVATTPNGTRAYVTKNDGTVSVIDTATNTVIGIGVCGPLRSRRQARRTITPTIR